MHLLEKAITAGTMTATDYNILDFQGHNLIKYILQEKGFHSISLTKNSHISILAKFNTVH